MAQIKSAHYTNKMAHTQEKAVTLSQTAHSWRFIPAKT